jgi:hypothetical protein
VNDNADQPKKPRQPVAYTVGAPVAIVLFVALLIGSVIVVRSSTNTGAERREQERAVVEVLRTDMPQIFPPDNAELAGVTVYAEAGMDVVSIRIHGLLDRRLQERVIATLREARAEGTFGSAIVKFHYPEARPEGLDPDSDAARIPIYDESPEPFREVRL